MVFEPTVKVIEKFEGFDFKHFFEMFKMITEVM